MNLPKNTIFFLSIIGLVVVLLFLVLTGVLPGLRNPRVETVTFTFWSTEPEAVWKTTLEKMAQSLPAVKINYAQKPESTFRQELVEAQASLRGPDFWIMPGNLLQKDSEKITPVPLEILNPANLQDAYVDGVSQEITFDHRVWGIPITFSTLALYTNTTLLNSAGIVAPPTDWNEFKEATKFLTQRDERGKIIQSGAALGLSSNVFAAPELFLSLLWQQGGEVITDGKVVLEEGVLSGTERFAPAESALQFLAEFSNPALPQGGWLPVFGNSEDEFAQERVAMIIGDEKTQQRLLEKNPRLQFKITPLPQPRDARNKVLFGTTRVLVISRIAANQGRLWPFIQALSQPNAIQNYLTATISLSPRRDLIGVARQDVRLRAFADQILVARSWPDQDPQRTRPVFKEMIEQVGSGRQTALQAVHQAQQKLRLIYGTQ